MKVKFKWFKENGKSFQLYLMSQVSQALTPLYLLVDNDPNSTPIQSL